MENETTRRSPACQDCGRCLVDDGGTVFQGTREEIERIAQEVIRRLREEAEEAEEPLLPVGVSVRHVHLTREAVDRLYGPGYELRKLRELYQPGEYAAQETVAVVGPRMRAIERVRILAPLREYSQVELARTDGFLLGMDLPVRNSGDLEDAPSVTLVGPMGSLHLEHGAIRPMRHIHMSPTDAERFGLAGKEQVRVVVPGPKGLIFENVVLKLNEKCLPELHLDTDDANAADLSCGDKVKVE